MKLINQPRIARSSSELRESQEARFWSNVDIKGDDSCWEWTGKIMGWGYGQIKVGDTSLAHRISWELHRGKIPDGMFVLHKCDNPACVNPKHLFLGTAQDNTHDMLAKGREARGESHGRGKLKNRDILAIRHYYSLGLFTHRELGLCFGVKRRTIGKIVNRERWRHL